MPPNSAQKSIMSSSESPIVDIFQQFRNQQTKTDVNPLIEQEKSPETPPCEDLLTRKPPKPERKFMSFPYERAQ